jgi:hypothetical protein
LLANYEISNSSLPTVNHSTNQRTIFAFIHGIVACSTFRTNDHCNGQCYMPKHV